MRSTPLCGCSWSTWTLNGARTISRAGSLPTNATDNRIFSLAVKDLVGDHDVQIEASGMNKDGKLTLDIFRRGQDPHGTELVYVPVCQIVADDIHVEESDRPDTYAMDQKNGDSLPVDTFVRDPDSQDVDGPPEDLL